eukprot:172121-Hanusia_phi.AAC.1
MTLRDAGETEYCSRPSAGLPAAPGPRLSGRSHGGHRPCKGLGLGGGPYTWHRDGPGTVTVQWACQALRGTPGGAQAQ